MSVVRSTARGGLCGVAMAAILLTGCSGEADPRTGVQGACAAPAATASPTTVHPGDVVEITVDYSLVDDCYDNFVNGTPAPPAQEGDGTFRDLEITWSQDRTTSVIGIADADSANRLRATVTVPPTAPAGSATLSATSADNVLMTVSP